MHKLSQLVENNWTEFDSPPLFERATGLARINAALPSGAVQIFERLICSLKPPYQLLYVLHTPRGEGEPGRYQSPRLTDEEFRDFMSTFGDFLASDARFDLWVRSPNDETTVVWDRRNLLYVYGQLDDLANQLTSLGFSAGTPTTPSPHAHNYHQEFDTQASDLLSSLEWSRTPLRPEDEQLVS
jgi:hypothetical protein